MTRTLTIKITAAEADAITTAAAYLERIGEDDVAAELDRVVVRIHDTADELAFPDPAQRMAEAAASDDLETAQQWAPVVSALALDAIADAIALPNLDT